MAYINIMSLKAENECLRAQVKRLKEEKTTEELLDLLPKYIVRPKPDTCDGWHTVRIYHFDLGKDTEVDGYCLSYYNYLYDDELMGFEGSLHEVASKMYDWCKANKFLEDK